jgi:hypothetical protein
MGGKVSLLVVVLVHIMVVLENGYKLRKKVHVYVRKKREKNLG